MYCRQLHTEAADIWAVGLVYFSIMEGRSGFSYHPPDDLQSRIKKLAHTPHKQETPQSARDFFRQIIGTGFENLLISTENIVFCAYLKLETLKITVLS